MDWNIFLCLITMRRCKREDVSEYCSETMSRTMQEPESSTQALHSEQRTIRSVWITKSSTQTTLVSVLMTQVSIWKEFQISKAFR